MKKSDFDRYWLIALNGYLALIIFPIAYCYWYETPQSASPFLMLLSLAVVLGFAIAVAIGTWGLASEAYWRGALVLFLAFAGPFLLFVSLKAIGKERSGLALAAAVDAVHAQDASGLQNVEGHGAEVYTHFFRLRMKDGRVFVVTVEEKGRSFCAIDVAEHEND